MNNPVQQLPALWDVSSKVSQVFTKRLESAAVRFTDRAEQALAPLKPTSPDAQPPADLFKQAIDYALDSVQRSVLFWDALRERGNNFVQHERAGLPPVLHFEYEMVMDGRTFERPVNYALLRILPPAGVTVDSRRRPYIIIDPRGGHGPGIGGFKDDSQVGVALHDGHPVYFVIFFREPQPGQTLLDVCAAEREFVQKVRELHPDSAKPAIVGNCQAGWAAMMLAAANPDETGPIVVVGAPMSYWGGAWRDGEGDNPMRYAGGLLGGTWLASLASDLGNGRFDGAWLVQNFENLNPANTFWSKYYNVYANVDTEKPRFLEFERWWGGYYLLNREEIEWITQNLFVGNRLWSGGVRAGDSGALDLKKIKAPIVLFASLGDNITPPQQAFNWVADVYRSTEEIKLNGQVIVGLMHEDVGHLGIFVSGKVARKEHAQIVSVLKSIEALPAGLYGMHIDERKAEDGRPAYDVSFVELRLEDVVARLNRYKRMDEKPFQALEVVSEFNQRAYELFGRPVVQALASEEGAKLARALHPLRAQRWALSNFNPFMWWLEPAARAVGAQRHAAGPDNVFRKLEAAGGDLISASLDGYRALRDAVGEASFFEIYGSLFATYLNDQSPLASAERKRDPRELPFVKNALASIDKGGYPEALARVAYLLAHKDEPLPLARLQLADELLQDYRDLLPELSRDEVRRIGGEQEVIARYERDRAVETLPLLLPQREDRERLLELLDRLLADKRVQRIAPTREQVAMLARIRKVLAAPVRRHARGGQLKAAATA